MKRVHVLVNRVQDTYYFHMTSTQNPSQYEDIAIPDNIHAIHFQKSNLSLEVRVTYFPTLTSHAVMFFRFSTAKDMKGFMNII